MSRSLLCLVGAALLALPSSLAAQVVRGRFLAADDQPMAGAHVALLDTAGATVRATLTDSSGVFSFVAPMAGRYSLRGEAGGHGEVEVAITVERVRVSMDLRAAAFVVELPTKAIRPTRSCEVGKGQAAQVAALWREVRKALRATSLDEDQGIHRQERRTWVRQLDPDDLRTLGEQVRPTSAFGPGSGLRSPPAEELAQYGYIQGGENEGYSFYAPDTRTLLSPVFTDTHCLGFQDSSPEDGWVGLTFRPRFEGGRDIEGTLWIDAQTLGPQRMEYRYVDLPWAIKTDKAGGQIDFHRLDDGPWVVQRWWIRSPRVGVRTVRLTQWDEPRQQFGLSGVVEEGGEVVRVQRRDGRIEQVASGG